MRRADRLFQIVLLLRKRRAVTARELAESLEISERTVYRDIRDLMVSGVPIDGEAGVGYRLHKGFELPPLMFTLDELLALHLGARLVKSWSDPTLARAADTALERIKAILPEHVRAKDLDLPVYVPDFFIPDELKHRLGHLRRAVAEKRRASIEYRDKDNRRTQRVVRPLALFYWGGVWTVGCWCELRADFRDFRLDRIFSLDVLDDHFADEPGQSHDDYFARIRAEHDSSSSDPASKGGLGKSPGEE